MLLFAVFLWWNGGLIYISFLTKVMEFPYSLVWNYTWNFVLITKINKNISIVKKGKSKKYK